MSTARSSTKLKQRRKYFYKASSLIIWSELRSRPNVVNCQGLPEHENLVYASMTLEYESRISRLQRQFGDVTLYGKVSEVDPSGHKLYKTPGEIEQILIRHALGTGDSAVAAVDETLRGKRHWMECTVKNETQFDIFYETVYFNSGNYYATPPSKIEKYHSASFSVCNAFGLADVSGGNLWRLRLDNNTSEYFSLGFTDPDLGARRSAAVPSVNRSPHDGYGAATAAGAGDILAWCKGRGEDQQEVWFMIELMSVTGHHTTYTIQQLQLQGTEEPF
nr:hypothetical protein CFP56_04552 [Quercus suber]